MRDEERHSAVRLLGFVECGSTEWMQFVSFTLHANISVPLNTLEYSLYFYIQFQFISFCIGLQYSAMEQKTVS